MSMIDEILQFNKGFVEREEYKSYKASKYPSKKLAIISYILVVGGVLCHKTGWYIFLLFSYNEFPLS